MRALGPRAQQAAYWTKVPLIRPQSYDLLDAHTVQGYLAPPPKWGFLSFAVSPRPAATRSPAENPALGGITSRNGWTEPLEGEPHRADDTLRIELDLRATHFMFERPADERRTEPLPNHCVVLAT